MDNDFKEDLIEKVGELKAKEILEKIDEYIEYDRKGKVGYIDRTIEKIHTLQKCYHFEIDIEETEEPIYVSIASGIDTNGVVDYDIENGNSLLNKPATQRILSDVEIDFEKIKEQLEIDEITPSHKKNIQMIFNYHKKDILALLPKEQHSNEIILFDFEMK